MNKLIVSNMDTFIFDYAAPRFDDDGNEMHMYVQTIYLGKNDSADNYAEIERFKTYYAPEGFVYQENNEGFITIDLLKDSIDNHMLKEAQKDVSN